MITEKFDEGLVLLRRLMHWHFIDITYSTLNLTAAPRGQKKGRRPRFEELPDKVSFNEIGDLAPFRHPSCSAFHVYP